MDLPLPQFVLPHVLGAMHVLLVSPPEADTWLCTISEKFGLLAVGTEALLIARFFLPVMVVLGQKSRLKTMKLQEAEWKVR